MTKFEKSFDISTFLTNQSYSSQDFFRDTSDKIGDVSDELFKIVSREFDDLRKRNEIIEKTIQIEALRLEKIEKDLPKPVVKTIKRFQNMLNLKFEYTIKGSLRNSMVAYNRSFQNILDRFERLLNKPKNIDYSNLTYDTVLDYQNIMEYQNSSIDCPSISIKLFVEGKKILLDKEYLTLKDDLKKFFDENIEKSNQIPCVKAKNLYSDKVQGFMKITETELEFIKEQKNRNNEVIDKVFSIVETFMNKIKTYEFVFEFRVDKIGDLLGKLSYDKLKKQMMALKRVRDEREIVFFKNKLNTGIFVIDCTSIIEKLNSQLGLVISKLVEVLIDKIAKENVELDEDIKNIIAKMEQKVESLEELEERRNYTSDIDGVLKNVMKKIKSIMSNLSLVEEIQFQITYDQFEISWKSLEFPRKVREYAQRTLIKLDRREKELGEELRDDQVRLDLDIANINVEFDNLTKRDSLDNTYSTKNEFVELDSKMKDCIEKSEKIQNGERIMKVQKFSDYSNLNDLKKTFNPYYKFWDYANSYIQFKERLNGPLEDISKSTFNQELTDIWNDLFKLEKNEFKMINHMRDLCKQLRSKYNELKPFIPLINDLKNESMKSRHWDRIMSILNIECEANEVQKLSFQVFLQKGAMENRDLIKEISEIASKENNFVRLLGTLKSEWKAINFEIKEFKNTGKNILKNIEPITDKLDEDIAKLSSVLSSPYVKFLENDIVLERTILIQNQEIIDIWIKVQKHFQYLHPIFSSEDIIKQRPNEAMKFNSIESIFDSIMDSARNNPNVPE